MSEYYKSIGLIEDYIASEEIKDKEPIREIISKHLQIGREKPMEIDKGMVSILERCVIRKKSVKSSVMSIDIRDSSELMTRTSAKNYLNFITGLTLEFGRIITSHGGLVEKFTGDGILAYFPSVWSGNNGLYNCCLASTECHKFFDRYYKEKRKMFAIDFFETIGLGIGIDFGDIIIQIINGVVTIIGDTVVFACRFSNAPANKTILNSRAYENVKKIDGISFTKGTFEIKNVNKPVTVYYMDCTSIVSS